MARDNSKETEHQLGESEKTGRTPKGTESDGVNRRLDALEKSASDLNGRIFDSHKWFVSIVFSVVAAIIVALGGISFLQVRDSTKEMEGRVNRATTEMEKKVQSFVGEALKKPLLEAVTADGSPLEGTTNVAFFGGMQQIYTVFLKNAGEKRTEPLSIAISLGSGFQLESRSEHDWEQTPSVRKEFSITFYSKRTTTTVAPGQTLNVQSLLLDGDLSAAKPCELEVFYGGEKPLRTRFFIKAP